MRKKSYLYCVLVVVFFAGCAGPHRLWLEPFERYTVKEEKQVIFSFVPPSVGRWHVSTPITMNENGWVKMTIYLDDYIQFTVSYFFSKITARDQLFWRQDVQKFLISGDIEDYLYGDTYKRSINELNNKPFIKEGIVNPEYRKPITTGGYNCGVIGYSDSNEKNPETIRISCPMVVDGKPYLLTIKTRVLSQPVLAPEYYRENWFGLGYDPKKYDLKSLFNASVIESANSIVVNGEKISQNIKDVEDLTIFKVPRIKRTFEYKAPNRKPAESE